MNIESFLEKITTPASPDSVLVFEASFHGLKAVVVDKKDDKLTVGQEVKTELTDISEAVEDVLKKIRQTGWKGQRAIMVSPAACLSVLDLHIPVKNKLPVNQIAETMQWEMEPIYNQHKRVLVIGQLLQLAGHLKAEQVDEVLQRQNELINSKSNTVAYKRFGELAVEAGLLTKKQIEDSLERQRWFVSESDVLKCGWKPLAQQPMADNNEYKWVVAGVNQDVLRAWQAAFSKQEVKLDAIYPAAGSGELRLEEQGKSAQAIQASREIVLEIHDGIMTAAVMVSQAPMQINIMPCTDGIVLANALELVTALGQEDDVPVSVIDCLGGSQQQSEQLQNDIKTILDRPVELNSIVSSKISLPTRNAVKKFFRVKEAGYVEAVSTDQPLPAVMQRFPVRAVLAGFLIFGLIILAEVGLFASHFWYKTRLADISEDVNKIRTEKKRINTKIEKVTKLAAEIKKKEAEQKNAITMISLLTKELPERNQMLSQLMLRLNESVTEDVVINSITEDTLLGFNFNAWALSDQAAQGFVKKFQLAIHPMDFRIKNLTVNEETGRLGLIGYSVKFSITQHSETEWAARKSRPKVPKY